MRRTWSFIVAGGLAALGDDPARAGDVQFYGVVKLHQYEQGLAQAPRPAGATPYSFQALVVGSTNDSVSAATVKPPGTLPERTLVSVTNGLALLYEERFPTAGALDAAFPSRGLPFIASTYTYSLTTAHEGRKTASVSYLGVLSEPPVAELLDLTAAQVVDTTTGFVLHWKPLNGTLLDLVQVAITDPATNLVFASPLPFTDGALNGQATEIEIPPHVLPPGSELVGHVIVARAGLPNTNSVPGAIGFAGVAKDTAFPLQTRPAPVPPRLELLSGAALPAVIGFTAERNRVLHLQGSTNLVTWNDLLVTNAASGRGSFSDLQSTGLPRRLYRMQVGP